MKEILTEIIFDAYFDLTTELSRVPSAAELAERLMTAGVSVASTENNLGCWLQGDYGRMAGTDANYEAKCSLCGCLSLSPSAFCPDCGRPMFSSEPEG